MLFVVPLTILKMMNEGYKKVDGTFFIDTGCVLVTEENKDSYQDDLDAITEQILKDLPEKYLTK